jgi:hypothetical protein
MNLLRASITDVTVLKAMPHVEIRTRIEGTASLCSTEKARNLLDQAPRTTGATTSTTT